MNPKPMPVAADGRPLSKPEGSPKYTRLAKTVDHGGKALAAAVVCSQAFVKFLSSAAESGPAEQALALHSLPAGLQDAAAKLLAAMAAGK